LAGRVGERELSVGLRSARFDPLREHPAVAAELRSPGMSGLRLIQFHAPPTPGIQRALRAVAGEGAILRFVPECTVIARIDARDEAAVRALACVRWVGPFHTAYKLDEEAALEA